MTTQETQSFVQPMNLANTTKPNRHAGFSKKSWAIIIIDFNTPVLRQRSLDLEWSAVVSDLNPYGGEVRRGRG